MIFSFVCRVESDRGAHLIWGKTNASRSYTAVRRVRFLIYHVLSDTKRRPSPPHNLFAVRCCFFFSLALCGCLLFLSNVLIGIISTRELSINSTGLWHNKIVRAADYACAGSVRWRWHFLFLPRWYHQNVPAFMTCSYAHEHPQTPAHWHRSIRLLRLA